MIALGVSQAIEGLASATGVNFTISGLLLSSTVPPTANTYEILAQGALTTSAASLYNPGGSATALVSWINLYNTTGAAITATLYMEGTASSNEIATISIPGGGWAEYDEGHDWTVYSSSGLVQAPAGSPGGVGTPGTSAQSLTASQYNLLTGSSIALATNQLFVGSRYRWTINLLKTAAGVATWAGAVKFGTANTNADAAIATWTSGTNTGAIDQAIWIIDMTVTALGSSATANCSSFYVNSLTSVTGLGQIAIAPTPTATFNSTSTSPYLHVDVSPGASAVMTACAAAERLV